MSRRKASCDRCEPSVEAQRPKVYLKTGFNFRKDFPYRMVYKVLSRK